jgi:hypothetical protein
VIIRFAPHSLEQLITIRIYHGRRFRVRLDFHALRSGGMPLRLQ